MTTTTDTRTQHSAAPTVTRESIDRRIKLFNALCAGVLIAFALLWLVPIAWTLDTCSSPPTSGTGTRPASSPPP
jgi:multiple sugar transport system permease protein